MANAYAAYRGAVQLPTAVDACVHANFLAPSETNLVIVRNSVLEVFTLRYGSWTADSLGASAISDTTDAGTSTSKSYIPQAEKESAMLQLVVQKQLNGVVESIRAARYHGASRDSLLISVEGPFLSRLDYSPETDQIVTTAMHSHGEAFRDKSSLQSLDVPTIAVDPDMRCCAVVTSSSSVLICPFRGGSTQDGVEVSLDVPKRILASQPIAPSDAFGIDLMSFGIVDIIDIQFLEGFVQPTLAILHQLEDTWAGRTAVRSNTRAVTSVLIDLLERKHYSTSSIESLPYSAKSLVSVPLPAGGFLVVSANAFIYCKQTVDFVLSVNEYGDSLKHFRVSPTKTSNAVVCLDGSCCTFLDAEDALVCLDNGDVYLLSIHSLGDTVHSMDLTRVTRSHPPSCACRLDDRHFFLGSRLGDSLLVEYRRFAGHSNLPLSSHAMDVTEDRATSRGFADDDEELDWFFHEDRMADTGQSIEMSSKKYTLAVRDSLICTAPVAKLAVGFSNLEDAEDTGVDIVACTGFKKNGALAIFQSSVRPVTLTSTDLNCRITGAWSLFNAHDHKMFYNQWHSYIVLSMSNRTLVLSCGDELREADDSGFDLTTSTIAAGNMQASRMMLQISSELVSLIERGKVKHKLKFSVAVTAAFILDPYAIVLCRNGTVQIVDIPAGNKKQLRLRTLRLHEDLSTALNPGSPVTAATIFIQRGSSLLFTPVKVKEDESQSGEKMVDQNDDDAEYDAIAEELFGAGEGSTVQAPREVEKTVNAESTVFVAVVCRSDGRLEFYRLPTFEVLFWCPAFPAGLTYLANCLEYLPKHCNPFNAYTVDDILVGTLWDHESALPYILAVLSNGDLIAYRAFSYEPKVPVIPVRFSRVQIDLITRAQLASPLSADIPKRKLTRFENVASRSGCFIGGAAPAWVFGERGFFRLQRHALTDASEASCFIPFHSAVCDHGFVVFDSGVLRMCELPAPAESCYDTSLPVRKVPLHATPHFVAFDASTCSYAVAISYDVKAFSLEEETDRTLPVTAERFELRLHLAGSLHCVETWTGINEDENITCLAVCKLQGVDMKLRTYYGFGTSNGEGEEVLARGRIFLVEVYDTTPSDTSGAGLRLKEVISQKEKGTVSAMASIQGFLCVATGQRVVMYKLAEDELVGCAFYDCHFYVATLSVVKTFIVLGDFLKSTFLLHWEYSVRQLIFLGSDFDEGEIYSTEFMLDGDDPAVVAADGDGNLRIMAWAPYKPWCMGGKRLLRRADFHVGTRLSDMQRLRVRDVPGIGSYKTQFMLLCGSIDGGLSTITPVSELLYRRLWSLQTQLAFRLPHIGGLSPIVFRQIRANWTDHVTPVHNVADLDLLFRYLDLHYYKQDKLAKNIGATRDQLIDNLLEIDMSTRFGNAASRTSR